MKILNRAETQLLRDLAGQVADIAHEPAQEERRKLWRRHNRLENVGPLFLAFPEGAWRELLPHESLAIDDPFWSEIEWNLKHIIYHFEHHHDDHAIEPVLRSLLREFDARGVRLRSAGVLDGKIAHVYEVHAQ